MKVLTIGTFDLLHDGHLNLFQACKKLAQGGQVMVGVNIDSFVVKYKGVMPVQNENTRIRILQSLVTVNNVRFNNDAGHTLILQVCPDILVVGSDWATRDYYAQIGMTLEDFYDNGILLVYVPYTPGISSSQLRKKLNFNLENAP